VTGKVPNKYYLPAACRRLSDYEVVDGQQRLSTIFLILGALRDIAALINRGCYEIAYETRDGLAEFLAQPTPDDADQSIDKHYMHTAHQAIKRRFHAHNGSLRLRLLRLSDRAR
jgi:hypothetical protein